MSRFFARFLYPVNIVEGGNDIVYRSGSSGDLTITVPAGNYYLIEPTGISEIDNKFPSLFSAMQFIQLAEWVSPAGYRYKESIKFNFFVSALDIIGFAFSNPDFTFPKNILGFPSDIDEDVIDSATVTVSGTRSALGSWIAGSLEGGDWTSILSREEKEVYSSTDPIYRDTKIIAMREARRPREFRFENVPGLRVDGGSVRGTDLSYRELADLVQITDGFADDGDEVSLRQMYNRVNAGQPFLVQYENEDSTDLEDGLWEGLRLYSIPEHQSLNNWHDEPTPGGELYNVEFSGLVTDGSYDY